MARAKQPSGYVLYEGASLLDGAPIVVIATMESTNGKTGNMVQTWIMLRDHDPITGNRTGADRAICGNCPSMGTPRPDAETGLAADRSCYVDLGRAPMGIWGAYQRGIYPRVSGHAEIARVGRGRAVRIGAYGDGAAVPSYIWESLCSDCDGFTAYSHQSEFAGAAFIADRMMVSADSLATAEQAWARGYRSFRVVPPAPKGIDEHAWALQHAKPGSEIPCPNLRGVQCVKCQLCSGAVPYAKVQPKSIVIPAHGAGQKHHTAAAG
jgi:hypothetical protein